MTFSRFIAVTIFAGLLLVTGCAVIQPGPALSKETGTTEARTFTGEKMEKIIVDPNIFSAQGEAHEDPAEGWLADPTFIVRSAQTDVAAEALSKAIRRCHRVTYGGRELSDAEARSTNEYIANYESPVYLTDEGPMAYLDTKGEWPRLMAETMLRIVIEEVTRTGIDAYITTRSSSGPTNWEWPEWEPESGGTDTGPR